MSTIPFQVSARAAALFGRENVPNAEAALIELVKNSYDADADLCLITFDLSRKSITILDNGHGMNNDTIIRSWMRIGTDEKIASPKSPKGRIRAGAKGLGRLSLDRLGERSLLFTQSKGSDPLFWLANWQDFDDTDKNVHEVTALLRQSSHRRFTNYVRRVLNSVTIDPQHINNINTGTVIRILGLKDMWDVPRLEQLYKSLTGISSIGIENSFSIYLFLKGHEGFGQIPGVLSDDFDYYLKFSLQNNGQVSVRLTRNELNVEALARIGFFKDEKIISKGITVENMNKISNEYIHGVSSFIPGFNKTDEEIVKILGPLDFDFYFLKAGSGDKEDEKKYKPNKVVQYHVRRQWLELFGGIKIYRDGFRVKPYGDVSSNAFDWLGLGTRSAKSPTVTRSGYAVRPYQVFGIVSLSRILNPNLDDKSNRDGLLENDAFNILKELVLGFIKYFEKDRNEIMMRIFKIYSLIDAEERKRKEADQIAEKVLSEANDAQTSNKADIKALAEGYKIAAEQIHDLKEEQKLLRVLATSGLVITSFTHELKGLSDKLKIRPKELRSLLGALSTELNLSNHVGSVNDLYIFAQKIENQDNKFINWLRFAIEAVKKDKRTRKKVNLVSYTKQVFESWRTILEERDVSFNINSANINEFYFNCHEIDLDTIFNNLIINSLDAFMRKGFSGRREILISFNFSTVPLSIIYKDSGPGLSADVDDPNKIFDLFYSTKRDSFGRQVGTGMGLWIVQQTVLDYRGELVLLEVSQGFSLRFSLSN